MVVFVKPDDLKKMYRTDIICDECNWNTFPAVDGFYCAKCNKKVEERKPESKDNDPINPDYYKVGGIEAYQYNRAKSTPEQYEGWLLNSVRGYLDRYNFKHTGNEQLKDLKKASWFLNKLIQFREENE